MYLLSSIASLSIIPIVLAGNTCIFPPFADGLCSLDALLPASGYRHAGIESEYGSSFLTRSVPLEEQAPWTRTPECHHSSNDSALLCVFTSTTFAHGRGISILTDEATAKKMSVAVSSAKSARAVAPSCKYIIRELPGRGKGVIANQTIERGDEIMAYSATTIFSGAAMSDAGNLGQLALLHKAVDHLPSHSRATWLNLAAHFDEEDSYIERINTNAFSDTFNGQEHFVVIPEVARMNHDCRPNAMYYFDSTTFTQHIHATRTIYAGEEITITYIDPLQTHKERRAATKLSWGFKCTCSLCTQSTALKHASDKRIKTIVEVTAALTESSYDLPASAEMAELLVSLYDQERLYTSVAEAYVLAARAYKALGNKVMALKSAMKAVELGIMHSGPKDEDVKEMWNLVHEPWNVT